MKSLMFMSLVLIAIFMGGCTKDDENPGEYYMRFKSNGVLVEYTNQLGLSAGFAQNGNQYVGTISGWNDSNSNLSLLLYSNSPISSTTYSGYASSVNGVSGVLFAHKDKKTGAVFSSGVTPDFDATVTITEITETGVKGTFSGKVTSTGHPEIAIREGSFFVKRVLN